MPTIAALRNAAAGALTLRFGEGPWSALVSERSVSLSFRHSRVRVGRHGKKIVSVLRMAPKKPWAIDVSYFSPAARPLYLTDMVVSVAEQGGGLGRKALEDAIGIAESWPADAIRLDAYDAEAGAGPFYAHCGFAERGRVIYRRTPLIYYECLLTNAADPVSFDETTKRARAVADRAGKTTRGIHAAIGKVRQRN